MCQPRLPRSNICQIFIWDISTKKLCKKKSPMKKPKNWNIYIRHSRTARMVTCVTPNSKCIHADRKPDKHKKVCYWWKITNDDTLFMNVSKSQIGKLVLLSNKLEDMSCLKQWWPEYGSPVATSYILRRYQKCVNQDYPAVISVKYSFGTYLLKSYVRKNPQWRNQRTETFISENQELNLTSHLNGIWWMIALLVPIHLSVAKIGIKKAKWNIMWFSSYYCGEYLITAQSWVWRGCRFRCS